jgi:hypothetical protein
VHRRARASRSAAVSRSRTMRLSCPFPPRAVVDRGAGTGRCLRAEVIPRC